MTSKVLLTLLSLFILTGCSVKSNVSNNVVENKKESITSKTEEISKKELSFNNYEEFNSSDGELKTIDVNIKTSFDSGYTIARNVYDLDTSKQYYFDGEWEYNDYKLTFNHSYLNFYWNDTLNRNAIELEIRDNKLKVWNRTKSKSKLKITKIYYFEIETEIEGEIE